MRRGDPQNGILTSSSWELSRLCSICRKKPFFVTLFKFIVCYLFFVLFLGEIDYKERIRKPYRSCSLRFSTMVLILDENKHGCSNVLSVTLLWTEQAQNGRQMLSQRIWHVQCAGRPAYRDRELETWLHARSALHWRAKCAWQDVQRHILSAQTHSAVFFLQTADAAPLIHDFDFFKFHTSFFFLGF